MTPIFYLCHKSNWGVSSGNFHKLSSDELVVMTRRDLLISTRSEAYILLDVKGRQVTTLSKR